MFENHAQIENSSIALPLKWLIYHVKDLALKEKLLKLDFVDS